MRIGATTTGPNPFAAASHARELPVWLWYPAEPVGAARPAAYMPDSPSRGDGAGVNVRAVDHGTRRVGVGKPFLFLFADRPIFQGPTDRQDARTFLDALARIRASTGTHPSLLLVRGAEHFNFFDQALLTEPTIWRWFGAMGPIDQTRALQITRQYVRAFFDAHLKHRPSALLEGPAASMQEVRFP